MDFTSTYVQVIQGTLIGSNKSEEKIIFLQKKSNIKLRVGRVYSKSKKVSCVPEELMMVD